MNDITISPRTQGVAVLAVLGAIAAMIVAQLPELRRYLKIRSM
jgi:uncharacterized protein DUF6893